MKPQWIHENVHTGIGEHKNPTGGATNKTIMIHVKHCASNFDIVEIRLLSKRCNFNDFSYAIINNIFYHDWWQHKLAQNLREEKIKFSGRIASLRHSYNCYFIAKIMAGNKSM